MRGVPMDGELARLGPTETEHEAASLVVSGVEAIGRRSLDLDVVRALGLFGLSIPTAHGGAGLGLHATCSVVQALARHDRGVATAVGLHVGLGTRPLVAFGSDEARARWLPALAEGAPIAAFAATEPHAGSDIASIRTRAVLDEGGERLRLDGEKAFITNGGIAGVFTVLACTPGLGGRRRGKTMLLVERGDRGFASGKEEEKLGLRGSSTTSLSFDGVELPIDRVIGRAGEGEEQLMAVLAWGRTLMAAGCAGVADAAFARAVAHVKRRVQFARTLASLDVVREQIAEMAAQRFMIVALVRWAAGSSDDPESFARRSLAVKVLASEAAWSVVDVALQLHGGFGYVEGSGIPALLRDARVMRIFEGANDVLLLRAGVIAASRRTPARGTDARTADLHEAFTRMRDALVAEAGPRLARREIELHRLGRAALLCESADAVAARADAEGDELSAVLAARWTAVARRGLRELRSDPARRGDLVALTDAIYEGVAP